MRIRLDHFGILAPFYERFIPPHVPERLLHLLEVPAHGMVLDAGGGTGRVAQFLRGAGTRVIVLDESIRMLQEARKKRDLLSVCGHTESTPFSSQSFDRILMVDAFHHVAAQPDTARELWRLLSTGGRIVIEEPDVRTWAVRLIALGEKLALMRSHFIAPPRIAELFDLPGSRVCVEWDGPTAWVVVNKHPLS